MKSTTRVRHCLIVLLIVFLAGCTKPSPTISLPPEVDPAAFNPGLEDVSASLASSSVGVAHLTSNAAIYNNYYYGYDTNMVTTHAFDSNVSGQELDQLIINMTNYDLTYQSEQPQQSRNVVIRSVAKCYLNVTGNDITRTTDSTGLQYHVKQLSGSEFIPLSAGQTISLGDQPVFAVTVKNTTANLIEFSGSNCGPISPYGYARRYIARPSIQTLDLTYSYLTMSGTWFLSRNGSYDVDRRNTIDNFSYSFSTQAFPIGTMITIPALTGDVYRAQGRVEGSGMSDVLTIKGRSVLINTSKLQDNSYRIVLKDNFGQWYNRNLDMYRTIKLTPATVYYDYQQYGYYQGYRTQYESLSIDTEATTKLLARAWSGVTLAESVSFETPCSSDCFAFNIKIQSGQSVRTVTVSDIFGVTGSVDLGFTMGVIKESLKKASIRGEGMNLLTAGRWDNAVQVDYENIGDTPISYYGCRWKPEADIAQQLSRVGYESYGSKYARLEDLLFVCDDKPVVQTLKPKNYLYRSPKTANLAVPTSLQNTKVFAVKTPYTANNAAQIFAQTQLGIYVKQGSTSASVWLFDLKTGAPITGSAILNFYQLNSQGWSTSGNVTVTKRPYVVSTQVWGDLTALTAQAGDNRGFVTLGGKGNQTSYRSNDRSINLQSSITIGEVTDGRSVPTRGSNPISRIYAYTDRGLYKPGDQLFVAGWARKLTDIGTNNITVTGDISIIIRKGSDYETILLQASGVKVDQYGGFNVSFTIPSTAGLDDYYLEVTDADGARYNQTIKINEYQKPTFFIDQIVAWSGDVYRATIDPTYYFGSKLQSWTYITDRSATANSRGRWWWDDMSKSDYYYDVRIEYNNSSAGSSSRVSGVGFAKPISIDLVNRSALSSQPLSSKTATTITDSLSDETQTVVTYSDIEPPVSIGLQGSPYDWYYAKDISTLKPIKGVNSGETNRIDHTTYSWYYYDWKAQSTTQGVDGSLYYDGRNYQAVQSGSLQGSSWTVPVSPVSKPGDWLLIVQAWSKDNQEIGRNEKSIWYADGDVYNYGSMNNNYTLTVSIDQKQYDEGDLIPINITPYIKGATVLITVEQGDRIVEQYLKTLDGSQITIPTKTSYYPSAIVSVLQVAGSDLVNQSTTTKTRREPRMWQGYGQVQVNKDMFKLNLDITTDKQTYKPGDKVTLTVKTTDYKGKPIDARLSVGVVDKSLNDLYSYFKNPLSDFFMSLGTTITNYTNMKWIYQGLKVFTQEGSKGGGGGSRNPLGFLRETFDDVAYRRGGVYTKDGVWTTTFTLPDNLTTWTIDVVGVTRTSKVGTNTQNIIATKDLIIQPNLPLYVTIGDHIDVPVKVLGITQDINKLKDDTVVLSGSIKTIDGKVISRINTSTKLNSTTIVPITIDPSIYRYHEVIIELDGQIGSYRDYSRQSIPLRTNGLKQLMIKSSAGTKGSISHTIPANSIDPQVTLSLGQIPLVSLNSMFDYMIHYPYGCSEQTISTARLLLAAKDMTKYGLFTGNFSGDMVIPAYDAPFSLTKAIDNAKTSIRNYQSQDGGFTYWGNGETSYMLSAYIYGIVSKYPVLGRGYEGQVTLLERYLESNGGAANTDQYLYYLYHKSHARGGANLAQVKQIIDTDKTARVIPELLGAQIALDAGDRNLALTWFNRLDIDDFDGRQSEYGGLYPLLTPRSALLIYQKLINQLGGDKRDQLNDELMTSLIRQKDSQGMRGNSTVDGMAVLSMIAQYQQDKKPQDIICTITVDGVVQQLIITSGSNHTMTVQGSGDTKPLIEWSCSQSIIMDTKLDYGLLVPQAADLTRHNVEYLQWMIPSQGIKIGQTINAVAQFKITQPAPHTAVELYVPATLKLSDIINKKESSDRNPPFTVEGNYNCQPSHYEVRFDRLFLYYDTLEANQSCRITISALVAYSGSTISMPSKIWQMYDDSVYATQMPTIK